MAIATPDVKRPPRSLIKALSGISAATAAGELKRLGITDPAIQGPVTRNKGKRIVGPALTLQFLPKREDQIDPKEYRNP